MIEMIEMIREWVCGLGFDWVGMGISRGGNFRVNFK